MECNSLISALPNIWKQIIKKQKPPVDATISTYDLMIKRTKLYAYCYKVNNENCQIVQRLYNYWYKILDKEIEMCEVGDLFSNIYKVTTNTKLRSFQYRLLHNAVIFNNRLFCWKITQNNLCALCSKHKETVLHFFYDCEISKGIWSEMCKYCRGMDPKEPCNISKKGILLNQDTSGPWSCV